MTIRLGLAGLVLAFSTSARADEGGVSFWLPGQFGSLAAVPGTPGWSLGSVYYRVSSNASRSREFVVGGRVVAGLEADADLVFVAPTYTFAQPVAGGQASLALIGAFGWMRVGVDASLVGPRGNTFGLSEHDSKTGGSDLYPLATLKWNRGVHNYMVYGMAGYLSGPTSRAVSPILVPITGRSTRGAATPISIPRVGASCRWWPV